MKTNRLLWVLVLVIYLASGAKAQFYDSQVHYYLEAGGKLDRGYVHMVLFNGQKMAIDKSFAVNIKNKLRQDSKYFYNELSKILSKELKTLNQLSENYHLFKFNSSKSSKKNIIYENQLYDKQYPVWEGMLCYGLPPEIVKNGFDYCIFSQDHKTMIRVSEKVDGELYNKRYYVEIDKSELMPKASNYDFFE